MPCRSRDHRTLGGAAKHPIAHNLQPDTADPRRVRAHKSQPAPRDAASDRDRFPPHHQVDLAVAIDIGVDVRRAVIVSTARTSIGKAYRGPSRKGPAKHAYEAALKQDLPTDVRTIIERQYQGVKANHDRVRDLRNAAA